MAEDGFRLPHFQDRCEGGTPLTPERLAAIRQASADNSPEGLMLRDLLDEYTLLLAQWHDKPGARTETDRRLAELEALTAGLATEVSQVYEKLDICGDKLGEMMLLVRRMDGRDKRRVRALERLAELHADDDDDDS